MEKFMNEIQIKNAAKKYIKLEKKTLD